MKSDDDSISRERLEEWLAWCCACIVSISNVRAEPFATQPQLDEWWRAYDKRLERLRNKRRVEVLLKLDEEDMKTLGLPSSDYRLRAEAKGAPDGLTKARFPDDGDDDE